MKTASQIPTINFRLEDFEYWVYSGDQQRGADALVSLLKFCAWHGELHSVYVDRIEAETGRTQTVCTRIGLEPFNSQMPYPRKLEYYNRLASAISAYLSAPQLRFDDELYATILFLKSYLLQIFTCSSFSNLDHILQHHGILTETGQIQIQTTDNCRLLLMCYTSESDFEIDFGLLKDIIPNETLCAYTGLLVTPGGNYTAKSTTATKHLYEQAEILDDFQPDSSCISLFANPWMFCSYMDMEDRHHLKQHLNRAITNFMAQAISPATKHLIDTNLSRPHTHSRPRIVIGSERYRSDHAMYRCYHNYIEPLREHYELILVSEAGQFDEQSSQGFDQVIAIDANAPEHIDQVVARIAALQPDAIFYPSLGMNVWSILCCNIRIARHQMMSYGHPATSMSEQIDYGLLAAPMPNKTDYYQQFLHEKLIFDESNNSHSDVASALMPSVLPRKTLNDGIVRIAINSSLMKVTLALINICQIINKNSSVPIQFCFFNLDPRGLTQDAERKKLKKLLPNSILHAASAYPEYLQNLAQCDLALPTFPFGGSNSNVDLAILGIPKIISLVDADMAAETDRLTWSNFDLPDFLYTSSDEELLATAIYLIHNQPARESIRDTILAANPRARLIEDAPPSQPDSDHSQASSSTKKAEQNQAFVKAMRHIFSTQHDTSSVEKTYTHDSPSDKLNHFYQAHGLSPNSIAFQT